MNNFRKIMYIAILLFIAIYYNNYNSYAENVSQALCINKTRYSVSYNDQYIKKVNDAVNYTVNYVKTNPMVDDETKTLFVPGHDSDINYAYVIKRTAGDCVTSGGSYLRTSCPTKNIRNAFNGGKYSVDNIQKKVSSKFNGSQIVVTIDFSDMKNIINETSIRHYSYMVLTASMEQFETPIGLGKNITGNLLSKYTNDGTIISSDTIKKNGYKIILTVNKNVTGIGLEFYEKSKNSCNGSKILETMLSLGDIEAKNPANPKNNISCASNNICQQIINDKSITDEDKENYAKYCYIETVTIKEYDDLYGSDKIIKNIYEYLRGWKTSDESPLKIDPIISFDNDNEKKCMSYSKGSSTCSGTIKKTGKKFSLYSGSYFTVDCEDSYSMNGSEPSLVIAGTGFSYNIKYTLTRTCTMRFLGGTAHKKPQCTYHCETYNSNYDGNWEGGPIGGPNEDFDSCVNECDNGKYSQNCINSCYNKVYGENNKRSSIVNDIKNNIFDVYSSKKMTLLSDDKDYKIMDVGQTEGGAGPPSPFTGAPTTEIIVTGDNGVKHCSCYLTDWCKNHGTQCIETKGPAGCSDSPCADYGSQLNAIISDYNNAKSSLLGSKINPGTSTFTIRDSYMKDSDGKYYELQLTDKNGTGPLKYELKYNNSGVDNGGNFLAQKIGSAQIGDSTECGVSTTSVDLYKASQVFTAEGVVTPKAYLGKLYGNVAYSYSNNYYQIKKNSSKDYKLIPLTIKNRDKSYYDGDYKYYTSLYSRNLNVTGTQIHPELVTSDACMNLHFVVKGLGKTSNNDGYTLSNYCYYGVHNQNDTGGDKEPGHRVYIFRPIELSPAIFPGREPRWNWTDSARLNNDDISSGKYYDPYLGYHVKASDTIKDIVDKGYTIYGSALNSETDYEIKISPATIARIKQNNKDRKSYLYFSDEDVAWHYINEKIFFYGSRFLDSTEYINNAGSVRKPDIIGKNNG